MEFNIIYNNTSDIREYLDKLLNKIGSHSLCLYFSEFDNQFSTTIKKHQAKSEKWIT